MKTVTYDKTALKVIAELSRIVKTKDNNTPIKIVKDAEGIHVKAANSPKTILFTVDAPTAAFDFEGDELCFYNYGEFYDYFSLFDTPTMEQDIINKDSSDENEAVILTQGKRTINYPLSDSEVIKGAIKKVSWENPDTYFSFSGEQLTYLKRVIGLLGDKNNNLTFTFDGDEVALKAKTTLNNNSFEDSYELSDPVSQAFKITISDEVFKYLLNTDYRVEVKSEGLLRFIFETNTVTASVLVTTIDEEGN